jgi:histidine triad (HIT) family protein
MTTDCPFCQIARGESPAWVVFEDPQFVAFLDRRPLFAGHILLIPREHHATLTDLPADLVGSLFVRARLLVAAVEEALHTDGTFVAINNRVSQSVPHLHVHVVPRRFKDGLRGFFWPRRRYADDGEALATRDALIDAIRRLRPGRGER